MPILHKDLSRLSRDAKKLRKEVSLFTSQKVSTQESLDWVAGFFQWSSWNEMYVAWESNANQHDMWHDLRRKNKICSIITGESRLLSALKTSELNIYKENLNHIVEWFSSRYHPKKLPINKSTNFFFKKRTPSYLDLPKLRFREGVEMLSKDNQSLCSHLHRYFINTLERPGCIVYCKQMDVTEFYRAFKDHGYEIKIMSEDILFPSHIKAERLPMTFSLNLNSPFSVDYLLKLYLSRKAKDCCWTRHKGNEALAELVIALRNSDKSKTPLPYLPSDFKQILDISNKHKSAHVKKKANDFIAALCSDKEQIISKVKEGEPPEFLFEQYQYIAMQVSEFINKIREVSTRWEADGFDIEKIQRPRQGELLIVVISGSSHSDISFMSMITKSIMVKFSEKLMAESEDDIWVFNPNSRLEQSIINNENDIFDFKQFNSAKANLVLYGKEESYFPQTETLVTINDNDWLITGTGNH